MTKRGAKHFPTWAIVTIVIWFIAICLFLGLMGLGFFINYSTPAPFNQTADECRLKYQGVDIVNSENRETCIYNAAFNTNPSLEECVDLIDKHLIYSCKTALAGLAENYSMCEDMSDLKTGDDVTYRDRCIFSVALVSKNLERCSDIVDALWKEFCKVDVQKEIDGIKITDSMIPPLETLDLGEGLYGLKIPTESWYFSINLSGMESPDRALAYGLFLNKEGYGVSAWAYPTYAETVNSDEGCRDVAFPMVQVTRSSFIDLFKDDVFTEARKEQNSDGFFTVFESYKQGFAFTEQSCLDNPTQCDGVKTNYYSKYYNGYCYNFYISPRITHIGLNKAKEIIQSIEFINITNA